MARFKNAIMVRLDDPLWAAVSGLATRENVSVSTIIRDSIQRGLPATGKRLAAARRERERLATKFNRRAEAGL